MPIYLYQHPETGDVAEIVQKMNDVHEYEADGVKWKRIYTVPQTNIDTRIDPYSQSDFVRKTGSRRGSVGDMLDLSAEMSAKREASEGVDPVKRKFFDDYSAKTKGKKHLLDKPKKIETKNAIIEL